MWLELAGVEGGVEGSEPSLQVQVIGHWSYALEDFQWAHLAGLELPSAWQAEVFDG